MSFKPGDRVKTTEQTMGTHHTAYHNVTGTITRIRDNSTLPIMFRPDKNVPGEVGEWALFEDEVVPIPDYDYWKNKYLALRDKVDAFRHATEGM